MRHTPGRLTLALIAVSILVAISGATSVWGTSDRSSLIDDASGRHGQMSIAAFDMYRALSDADSAITSAFLPGQAEKDSLRASYEADISRASAAIATLADEAGSQEQVDQVAELSSMLPTYTGLIETARTYHRQGLPLGIAYLRDASSMVREQMLPITYQLQQSSMEDLSAANDDAAAFPWLATGLALVTLTAMGIAQHRLARRTNRVLNLGVAGGTLAVVLVTGWMLVAWGNAASHLSAGHEDGTRPLAALSQAHIDAQQARSDEALTLIAQGTDTDFEADFTVKLDALIGADGQSGVLHEVRDASDDPELIGHLDTAIGAATAWREAHTNVRAFDDNGDYDSAVEEAIGTDSGQAGAAFAALNEALTQANELAAGTFESETRAAGSALTGAGLGFSVLTVVALVAVWTGFSRRIAEYR